eukprot:GHVR01008168.1.p1 GENE.GHVR01008168.1~~GHVR01008168.1.p1  ORF type:complete len:497 (-),score=126.14 GHVR01008168.1:220-1710(-)
MLITKDDKKIGPLSLDVDTHITFIEQNTNIIHTPDIQLDDIQIQQTSINNNRATVRWPFVHNIGSNERLIDAIGSIQYILTNLIFVGHENISGKKLFNLLQVLYLLSKCIPIKDFSNSVYELFIWVQNQSKNNDDIITKTTWDKHISEFYIGSLPPVARGAFSCPHNIHTHTQHVNCQFWTLLHFLTVSASRQCIDTHTHTHTHTDNECRVTPLQISRLIRLMVSEYFACEMCRKHFLIMYDDCVFGRCTISELKGHPSQQSGATNTNTKDTNTPVYDESKGIMTIQDLVTESKVYFESKDNKDNDTTILVMWLWRLHNSASVRIASNPKSSINSDFKSNDNDKEYVRFIDTDVRWPPVDLCSICRVYKDGNLIDNFIINKNIIETVVASQPPPSFFDHIDDFNLDKTKNYIYDSYLPDIKYFEETQINFITKQGEILPLTTLEIPTGSYVQFGTHSNVLMSSASKIVVFTAAIYVLLVFLVLLIIAVKLKCPKKA